MPIGRSWWHHIRCSFRLGRHGCLCNIWWVWVKQWSNYLSLWPDGPVYAPCLCRRPEATSDVISGRFLGPVVPDNCVKFSGPRLNISCEVRPEAVCGGIFDCFCAITSDGKQLVTSYPVRLLSTSVWVGPLCANFGDSRWRRQRCHFRPFFRTLITSDRK